MSKPNSSASTSNSSKDHHGRIKRVNRRRKVQVPRVLSQQKQSRRTDTLKTLVCINELEKSTFLPGPVWASLEALNTEILFLDSTGITPETFIEYMAEHRPEILVSAWSTPRLPENEVQQVMGHLQLLTHLPGSLKEVLPRIYLEKGLIATNWGNAISRTVAECALMLILCCLRRTAQWQIELHTEGTFRKPDMRFLSLFERKVGIHGFGAIGRELVPLLRPFNVQISSYSPSVPAQIFDQLGVHKCETLEELFSSSNVVVELAPNIPKYYHCVTEELLRMLPDDGVFVNAGRGATVDEAALIRIAKEGRLQIGLDVYEDEPPPPDSPLRGLKNVCLLPHIGGPTIDRRQDAGKRAVAFIADWLNSTPPEESVSIKEYNRTT